MNKKSSRLKKDVARIVTKI